MDKLEVSDLIKLNDNYLYILVACPKALKKSRRHRFLVIQNTASEDNDSLLFSTAAV
jgi:hypothetical protein